MTNDNEKIKRPIPLVGQVEVIEAIEGGADTPKILKDVDVHLLRHFEDYSDYSAGIISAYMQNSAQGGKSAEPFIYIGFPVIKYGSDVFEKFSYPSDFLSGPWVNWLYTDEDGQEHWAETGTISLKVGYYFYSYEGSFSFTDRGKKTFKGSFKLQLAEPGSK